MKRRSVVGLGLGALANVNFARGASSYPKRTIRWIAPFPAGGQVDIVARKLAELAGPRIGGIIVVDNKPGASGSMGTAEAARAAPDGYTFAIAIPDSLISVASLIKSPGYDARKDLTLIIKMCHAQPVLVANNQLGARSMRELLEIARKRPGDIAYGSWGLGTLPHLVMKNIESLTHTSFIHVPYRGMAPALQDFQGNRIQVTLLPTSLAQQHEQRGTAIPLGVLGAERSPFLNHVPTLKEQGIEGAALMNTVWTALVGPKGLPVPIVERWVNVLSEVIRSPEFEQFLPSVGQTLAVSTIAQFEKELKAEYAATNSLIRSLGITPD